MTEEKPTKEEKQECRACINLKHYPQKCDLCSLWRGREIIRLKKIIFRRNQLPPAPKVVTREQVDELVDDLCGRLIRSDIRNILTKFLADFGYVVAKEKP